MTATTGATKSVVDASVAVKWFANETGRDEALALLADEVDLLAPDLLPSEFGNAAWAKVRRGQLEPDEAREMVASFLDAMPISLVPSRELLPAALEIALQLEHPIYDAFYLALARREACQFVTADERLQRVVRGTPLEPVVVPL